jgi:hypothetical protein
MVSNLVGDPMQAVTIGDGANPAWGAGWSQTTPAVHPVGTHQQSLVAQSCKHSSLSIMH